MAITNKAILDKIAKANKYIKTLKEQGLQDSVHAKKLREAVNRSSKGSKPRQYFYTPKTGGKISKQQRKQLLKVYEELKHVGKYIGGSTEPIKEHPFGTYAEDSSSQAIRESISRRYSIDSDLLTDQFFDFIGSDAVQKLFEQGVFGSDTMQKIIDAVKTDNSILHELDEFERTITDYVNNPHRDEYYIEEFEDIINKFINRK